MASTPEQLEYLNKMHENRDHIRKQLGKAFNLYMLLSMLSVMLCADVIKTDNKLHIEWLNLKADLPAILILLLIILTITFHLFFALSKELSKLQNKINDMYKLIGISEMPEYSIDNVIKVHFISSILAANESKFKFVRVCYNVISTTVAISIVILPITATVIGSLYLIDYFNSSAWVFIFIAIISLYQILNISQLIYSLFTN